MNELTDYSGSGHPSFQVKNFLFCFLSSPKALSLPEAEWFIDDIECLCAFEVRDHLSGVYQDSPTWGAGPHRPQIRKQNSVCYGSLEQRTEHSPKNVSVKLGHYFSSLSYPSAV